LGSTWLLSSELHTSYDHVLEPNSRVPDCEAIESVVGARSYHPQGVHALLGDGAVRFVSQSIDLHLWRALATIRGAETTDAF